MGATRPASGFLRQRLTNKRVISAVCEPLLIVYEHCIFPDARRVALSLQQLSGAAANLQTLLNRTL